MKAGIKTTEFWLSLLAILVGAFLASGLLPETHVAVRVAGMLSMVLGAFGYTWKRTTAKTGAAAVSAEALEAIVLKVLEATKKAAPVILVALLLLAPGCAALGAALQSGAQGQAQETATPSVQANPVQNIFNVFGCQKVTLGWDGDGMPVVKMEAMGVAELTGGGLVSGVVLYGSDAAHSQADTGGGSTAGSQPGAGGGISVPVNLTPGSGTTVGTGNP